MSTRLICDLCHQPIAPHAHYVVRIDVFADPSMPPLNVDDLEETPPGEALADLLEQMKGMSPEELQDQVHRRFEYRLCRKCQVRFLANPLGKPRDQRPARN